jgi:serine/threonine protein kinase
MLYIRAPRGAFGPRHPRREQVSDNRGRDGAMDRSGHPLAISPGAARMVEEDARAKNECLLEGTPYRAVKRLGAGGMGEIYEAVEAASGAPIVVKLLRADLIGHADLVDRMRLEGEILGLFSHPNIVAARGFGKTKEGRPYVAMERLKGRALRHQMKRRGGLPLEQALDIMMQLLSALEEVHAAGVVHRDIKPENIMVCGARQGCVVKLLDFGIAKSVGCAVAPLANPTLHGACVGTPRYTAPEQAKGGPVDRRADIYTAGLVLYALVAGRGPFDEVKEAHRVLEAHVTAEPAAPSRFAPLPLPPALDAAVLRALAKQPDDRFADATSFRRELAMIMGQRCIPLAPWLEQVRAASPPADSVTAVAPRFDLVTTKPDPRHRTTIAPRAKFSALDAKPRPRGPSAEKEPTRGAKRRPQLAAPAASGRASATAVSSFQVLLSAAAFAAAASGVAMWFVH